MNHKGRRMNDDGLNMIATPDDDHGDDDDHDDDGGDGDDDDSTDGDH